MKQYLKQCPGQVAVALVLAIAFACGVHLDPISVTGTFGATRSEGAKVVEIVCA